MKLLDILFEYRTPKKPKARPKKTLWFDRPEYWKHDLDTERPDHKLYYEENEETFYALDSSGDKCYGAWYGKKKRGVTFFSPRPKNATVSPRAYLKPYDIPHGSQ
jgi:hypothetical protein